MSLSHVVSLVVGALGAVAAYLVGADAAHAAFWQTISGVTAVLVPVFAMKVKALS
jgi:hypothetical protein